MENRTSCCTNSGGNIIGDYEDYILGYIQVINSYGTLRTTSTFTTMMARAMSTRMVMSPAIIQNVVPTGVLNSPGHYNNGGVYCMASDGNVDTVINYDSYGYIFLYRNYKRYNF